MHFYNEIQSIEGKPYLNQFHKELEIGEKSKITDDCALLVKDPAPQPSYWNGLKSNGYFPLFAKSAAALSALSALYDTPVLGTAALATVGAYKAVSYCRQCPSEDSSDTEKFKV